MRTNNLYLLFLLTLLLLLTSCSDIDLSQVSDEDMRRISDAAVVCYEPYMRLGISCCLDQNSNSICDTDESTVIQEDKTEDEEVYTVEARSSSTQTENTTEEENIMEDTSDEDMQRISDAAVVCDKPYIRLGTSCCLDQNNNSICDTDEFTVIQEVKTEDEEVNTIEAVPSSTQLEDTTEEENIIDDTSEEEIDSEEITCSSNTYNCDDFSSWSEAKEVYEECGGLGNDIHALDTDDDGIPCESLNGAPKEEPTEEEVKSIETKSYVCSSNFYNCGDFSSYSEALAVYNACGGLSNDVHGLDKDKDGEPCETLK